MALEALLCGNTEIISDMFYSQFLRLKQIHPRNGQTMLQNQSEVCGLMFTLAHFKVAY